MIKEKEVSKHALYMRQWRANHPEHKQYMKKYRKDNRKRINETDIAWRHSHPEQVRNWNNRYGKRNKHIKNVQVKALSISLLEYCELCPDEDKNKATQRHHPDYDYPLIIVSTCRECHNYIT